MPALLEHFSHLQYIQSPAADTATLPRPGATCQKQPLPMDTPCALGSHRDMGTQAGDHSASDTYLWNLASSTLGDKGTPAPVVSV